MALRNAFENLATESKLEQVRVLLASINSIDFATGADLATLETQLDTLNATDFATEATLANVSARLPTALVGGRLDVNVGASATIPVDIQDASLAVTVDDVTVSNFPATQAISAASLPLPTGAATQATLASVLAALSSVAVTGPLTDAQLRASAVPVSQSGTWTVDTELSAAGPLATETTLAAVSTKLPATNADGGLLTHVQNFPSSQAVTGPLTDTQLRASAVPVDTELSAGGPLATEATLAGTLTVKPTFFNGAALVQGVTAFQDSIVANGVPLNTLGVFDGTDIDRIRDIAAFSEGAATAVGSQAVGLIAFDGTNYRKLRSDTSGVLRVTPGTAASGIGDGSGGTANWPAQLFLYSGSTRNLARDAVIGDGAAATGILAGGNFLWNGTTWDRVRSASGLTGVTTVSQRPATAGGVSTSRLISAATTNATSVKASAGQVYGWYIFNANAATRYLKLYDLAAAPTVGTSTPKLTIPIPAGAAANVEFNNGIEFGTGIALALTAAVADADTTAVAADELVINLLYK